MAFRLVRRKLNIEFRLYCIGWLYLFIAQCTHTNCCCVWLTLFDAILLLATYH